MDKNQKNKNLKDSENSYLMEESNQTEKVEKDINIEIDSDKENKDEIESKSIKENEGNIDDEDEDEDEEKKEMREFTIELIIHTKVMDNREEIKKCICRNHIILNEKYNKMTREELEEKENIYIEREIIPSIFIPVIKETKGQSILPQLTNLESPDKFYIKLTDLTKSLLKIGFPLSGSKINIYVSYANSYIYFGTEPVDEKTVLYSFMLEPTKDLIKMKIINYIQKRMLDGYTNSIINTYFRKPIQKPLPSLEIKKIFTPSMTNLEYYAEASDNEDSSSSSQQSIISYDNDDNNLQINKNDDNKKKQNFRNMTDSHKRERKIGYIIEKVYAWRKLYNGYRDEKNNFNKYSLDDAAKKIDVSKKSLDDYLLQIRLGRKYGFDFDKNKYEKIGVLRDYVKKIKEEKPELIKKRTTKKKGKKDKKNTEDQKEENNNNIIEEESEIESKKIGNKSKNIKKNTLNQNISIKINNSKDNTKEKSVLGKKRKSKI